LYPSRYLHPNADRYLAALRGKRGIEIGGPSKILGRTGILPLYDVIAALDNCVYAKRTLWFAGRSEGEKYRFHRKKQPGTQIICEASDLKPIPDGRYEFVLASHCLEHLANPLRGLMEWRRILKKDGLLLLILPHKEGTFDWKRETTPLSHMVSDFENNTGEDDLTHLPEILAKHDLTREWDPYSKSEFHQRCLNNFSIRAMHHHVFETDNAVALIEKAGFTIISLDRIEPYHIVILAERTAPDPDNTRFLAPDAEYVRRSPFASDRLSVHGTRSTN
jgi:SAM-dependent methyltransferase